MSGGGGGGDRSGPEQSGMITLEDLESFSEDQLSDSGNGSLEEEAETMEEDDDRLLHYWQDVARGHQVEVAQGKRIIIILIMINVEKYNVGILTLKLKSLKGCKRSHAHCRKVTNSSTLTCLTLLGFNFLKAFRHVL